MLVSKKSHEFIFYMLLVIIISEVRLFLGKNVAERITTSVHIEHFVIMILPVCREVLGRIIEGMMPYLHFL